MINKCSCKDSCILSGRGVTGSSLPFVSRLGCQVEKIHLIYKIMPFTLAHPIAAAPIWLCSKRRLDLPSLLVGSMIPDLEYFLALQPTRTIGHTLLGVLIQGLPCSIVLLLVTRYVLMRPFLALLPRQLAQRFPTLRSYFPLQLLHLFNVVVSVVIGAASHLV